MKEAEEAAGIVSGPALDLDEAAVGILDLPDDSLGVGIARPGDHRDGRLDQQRVHVELGHAVDQHFIVVQS